MARLLLPSSRNAWQQATAYERIISGYKSTIHTTRKSEIALNIEKKEDT